MGAPPVALRHRTRYIYHQPVRPGAHRLLLRPRESRAVRLDRFALEIRPEATLTWSEDVFGNAVAIAHFAGSTDRIDIDVTATLRLSAPAWPVFPIDAAAIRYPFAYSAEDRAALGTLAEPDYADPDGQLRAWARGFVAGAETDTLALLKDLCAGVRARLAYRPREEEGTQTPAETLRLGHGACRDFAVLFADAARRLGFGARIVSGYLHEPGLAAADRRASGAMHAWADVYVPGAGWIAFDPTNNGVGGHNLVPVAVARHIDQLAPVAGAFVGAPNAFAEMAVAVELTAPAAPAPVPEMAG